MSKPSGIFFPQLPSWLTRLATAEPTRRLLLRDPVVFATWYAIAHSLLTWPAEAQAIQSAQRSKKMGMEQTMKLLSQLSVSVVGRTTAGAARELLEGYAVHEWASNNSDEFLKMVISAEDHLKLLDGLSRLPSTFEEGSAFAAMQQLRAALGLGGLEADILSFAVLCTASSEMNHIVEQFSENRWTADTLWTTIFAVSRSDMERALRPNGALRLSGLLQPSMRKGVPVALSDFWLQTLAHSADLTDSLLEPFSDRRGAGTPARLMEEDLALAAGIVKNEKGLKGVNLLLYGATRLDKRQLLKSVVEKAGRTAWRVRGMDEAGYGDRPSLVFLAQKLLAARNPDAVLIVERPADALTTAPSSFLRQLFGIEFDPSEVLPFDENLLSNNQVPTIWLASSAETLPDETVARFVFHAPLKKADRKERIAQLDDLLTSLKLTRAAREEILKLDGVSAVQLESAVKAAALSGAKTRKEKDAVVVQAVRRSQRALSRDITAKMKTSVTQYSLDYLNTAGRFGPTDILRCLKNKPKGAMVFYGIPGTGKTQFAEYLATELGMPLVSKKASDLLSKWLGESEKNIAAAFDEAASEDAILLLDEGDSFLRDRSQARESWQVTQVNELLQHIERFDGIVIVCTNLFKGLDAAALRRFTFKVEFRQLDADQRWDMFQVESGLKGKLNTLEKTTREKWFEDLCMMRQLTAGDFATVKRQCDMLGTTLTPQEWLVQLQLECDVKRVDDVDGRSLA